MAIVTFPAGAKIASIRWAIDRPAQINRSQWTGSDQVRSQPWHGRWSGSVTLAPIVSQSNVLAWHAFLAALKGRVNSFRIVAVEAAQTAVAFTPLVNGSQAAGITSLNLSGLPSSTTVVPAGAKMTVNDQLVVLTSALVSVGSVGIASFEPPLRAAAANATPVELHNPTAHVAMASSEVGWGVDPGQTYGISFDVEERF